LRSIAGNSTNDGVLLAGHTIDGALSVSFGLSSVVLCLAGSVLLLSGLLPRSGAGQVSDGLDGGALD